MGERIPLKQLFASRAEFHGQVARDAEYWRDRMNMVIRMGACRQTHAMGMFEVALQAIASAFDLTVPEETERLIGHIQDVCREVIQLYEP